MGKSIRTWVLIGIVALGGMLLAGTVEAARVHRGHHRGGQLARRYNLGIRHYHYGVRRLGSHVPNGTYHTLGFLNGPGLLPGTYGQSVYGIRSS